MYIPKYFKIQELVPPKVYEALGVYAWGLIDNRVLFTIDQLRRRYGPVIINTWHQGGDRKCSGLRTLECNIGAEFSQHKFGRAVDCLFRDVDAERVRQDILKNPNDFKEITSIELGTSWLHFDVRNCKRIKTFKP
jgi:hypothetical protein